MTKQNSSKEKIPYKFKVYAENVALTVVGGIGLLFASLLVNVMFSTPPTRAEFDAHKVNAELHLKHIDSTLIEIKEGQTRLINNLIERKIK